MVPANLRTAAQFQRWARWWIDGWFSCQFIVSSQCIRLVHNHLQMIQQGTLFWWRIIAVIFCWNVFFSTWLIIYNLENFHDFPTVLAIFFLKVSTILARRHGPTLPKWMRRLTTPRRSAQGEELSIVLISCEIFSIIYIYTWAAAKTSLWRFKGLLK